MYWHSNRNLKNFTTSLNVTENLIKNRPSDSLIGVKVELVPR